MGDVSSTLYWRHSFTSICNPKQLTEYIVMDIDILKEKVFYQRIIYSFFLNETFYILQTKNLLLDPYVHFDHLRGVTVPDLSHEIGVTG